MTKEEMLELKAVFRRAAEEAYELYNEVWMTDDELCKYFGTLKKSWLDRNWQALPKNCVRQPGWTDDAGVEHSTSRLYARNKIQRLFASGEIEHLRCRAVVG